MLSCTVKSAALSAIKKFTRECSMSTDVALILEDDVILNADINEIIKKSR